MARGLTLTALVAVVTIAGLPPARSSEGAKCSIEIAAPLDTNVVLSSVEFLFTVTLPPFLPDGSPLPVNVYYSAWSEGGDLNVINGSYSRKNQAGPVYSFEVNTTLHSYNHHEVHFNFSSNWEATEELCPGQEFVITLMGIPGFLTLLPPLITAIIAIGFRKVIIALFLGIWMCAFFAYQYNPLTATLRTVDKYFVESIANFEHSKIAVFSFFLGGLIGVVQKSGGGLGLAAILRKMTGSRRKASIACIILGLMIFFDDYTIVLIAGTSLRTVMDTAHVSKEKFAYILKSLGPTLPSLIPISSWIGVQVGNVQMALNAPFCKACSSLDDADPFVMTVSTLPYRFFPLLLLFTVLLIAIFNHDFGPMLSAERRALPTLQDAGNSIGGTEIAAENDSNSENENLELLGTLGSSGTVEEEIPGPLAPKKGIKYRWFNAAIPFLLTLLVTLLGMVLDGYFKIRSMPEDQRIAVTVVNIFTKADSRSALIWASALACVVTMVMLLVQRILTLEEYMTSWMEGVKDIIEPYMVLWLAWALGAAIQDIHTNNFLAKAMSDGGLDAKFIPAIVTIIGFLMSFAAGSAYGTMGILFPLVVPTVCKISACNKDAILQSSAAILASSIFGNVISPIAGICILTVFASQCPLERHIKSAALYSILVAVVSVLFGALPVGAGWYPWYEAWIVMAIIISVIFILFSSDTNSLTSQPLMQRLWPGLYTACSRLWSSLSENCRCNKKCLLMCSRCKRRKSLVIGNSNLNYNGVVDE